MQPHNARVSNNKQHLLYCVVRVRIPARRQVFSLHFEYLTRITVVSVVPVQSTW